MTTRTRLPQPAAAWPTLTLMLTLAVGTIVPGLALAYEPPVVSVTARDAEARELARGVDAFDSASFRLERTGDAARELTVFFSLIGDALPGLDYKDLGRSALFPVGARSLDLEVFALADDLVEGDESLALVLEPDPSLGPIERYRIDPNQGAAKAVIHDHNTTPPPAWVRIVTLAPETPEYCPPNARCIPGRFRITRTGSLADAQPVYLRLEGDAQNGVDYQTVPLLVTIPAGQPDLDVIIAPLNDDLTEGRETVVATVSDCPPPELEAPCYGFRVDPNASRARLLILDDEAVPAAARVVITTPPEQSVHPQGRPIRIHTTAVDPAGFLARLAYYADGKFIGESSVGWPECVGCEPRPGTPAQHEFEWQDAPPGRHQIVAQADQRLVFSPTYEEQRLDPPAASAPLHILVQRSIASSRWTITATQPVAEESSFPYRRLPLTGEIVIRRTGDLSQPASIFVHYEGQAENGVDYETLPWLVSLAPGEEAARLAVKAIPDKALEGTEKLIVSLSPCPPRVEPPLGMPCVEVDIDPNQARAAVAVCDDARCGQTSALTFVAPRDGEQFAAETPLTLQLVAVDPLGAITRVEFTANGEPIGVSELWFVRAPDPGTPIHHELTWDRPPVGTHRLEARAMDSTGVPVAAPPIHVVIGGPRPLKVAILRPSSGTVFAPADTIEIHALAASVLGPVARLQVFADDRLIASADQGELVARWDNPPLGVHVILAHALDLDGQEVRSEPVRILVQPVGEPGFVRRFLPDTFSPGVPFTIILEAAPPTHGSPWSVTEQPPTGMVIDQISHDGTLDPATGKVVFGPFTDLDPRRLTYRVTPSAQADALGRFTGEAKAGDQAVPIGGDVAVVTPEAARTLRFGAIDRQSTALRLELAGPPGQLCDVESSTDLVHWNHFQRVFVLDDGKVAFDDPTSAPAPRFFRVRLVTRP